MIGLVIFVLVFVLAGLTVVGLAMRSGRKRSPKPARTSRVALVGGAVATVAIGLAIPALMLAYNAGSQSKAAPGGIELTAAQQEGRKSFSKNCATCHTLASANAVGRVGPSLDVIIPAIAEEKARVAFINDAVINGRARGQGQMPKGLIDGTDQEQVSDFIATTAGR